MLLTFEQMLNPEAPTPKRLVVGKRPITAGEKARAVAMGKKPPRFRMTHSAARKEHAAALEVEKALTAGVKRASAVNAASKAHGLSEGALNARLANRAAWRRLSRANRQLWEAAGLAQSLQAGGILQGDALTVAAEVFGQSPAAIRKSMKES